MLRIPFPGLVALLASGNAAAAVPGQLSPGMSLSPWGMFMAADVVVKAVMIGLVFASLVTWTLWLVKSLEMRRARAALDGPLEALARAPSLAAAGEALASAGGLPAALRETAEQELEHSRGLPADGTRERVALALSRLEAEAARRLNRGTGLLATIGSTAPFVGLFGTVWGIMNSFIGIAQARTTNLAVVAPGIAEALLATALGLVAAIPAVMLYNHFGRILAEYRARVGDLSVAVQRVVGRDLDRQAEAPAQQAALREKSHGVARSA